MCGFPAFFPAVLLPFSVFLLFKSLLFVKIRVDSCSVFYFHPASSILDCVHLGSSVVFRPFSGISRSSSCSNPFLSCLVLVKIRVNSCPQASGIQHAASWDCFHLCPSVFICGFRPLSGISRSSSCSNPFLLHARATNI